MISLLNKYPCPKCGRRAYLLCPYCLIIFRDGRVILNSAAVTYSAAAFIIMLSFIDKMRGNWFGDFTILHHRNFLVPGSRVFIEYPLITWVIIQLCKDTNHTIFVLRNSVIVTICFFLSAYFLHKINGKLSLNGLIYFVVTLSAYKYILYNWDMVAVLFALSSLYFYLKEKFTLGGLFLALGTLTKLYPIFLILPTIYFYRRKIWRVVTPFIFFLLTLTGLYFFAVKDWYLTFLYHWDRGPNIDSIGGVILEAVSLLGGNKGRAWQWLSLMFTAALCLSVPLVIYKYRHASLPLLWSGTLCAVLLTSRIYSPQFNLWVLPLFALMPVNKVAFFLFELSSYTILFDYSTVTQTPSILFTVILARHVALAFITNYQTKETQALGHV